MARDPDDVQVPRPVRGSARRNSPSRCDTHSVHDFWMLRSISIPNGHAPRFLVIEADIPSTNVSGTYALADEIERWLEGQRNRIWPIVEVWRPYWVQLAEGSGSASPIAGLGAHLLMQSAAHELQTELRSRTVPYRPRHARICRRDAAELAAVAAGWPVRYV
jgi:hypothetical protein